MTADELKALRRELSCTARELAETIGVEQDQVLSWEREETFPTKHHVGLLESLRSAGASGVVRASKRSKRAPRTPTELFADPAWFRLLRKLMAHPELMREAERLAEKYEDPAEPKTPAKS